MNIHVSPREKHNIYPSSERRGIYIVRIILGQWLSSQSYNISSQYAAISTRISEIKGKIGLRSDGTVVGVGDGTNHRQAADTWEPANELRSIPAPERMRDRGSQGTDRVGRR